MTWPSHKETPDKSRMRDVLQNNCSVIFKSIKVMTIEEILRDCSRLTQTNETWWLSTIPDLVWKAIKDVIEKLGKLEWTYRWDSSNASVLISWYGWLYSVYKCFVCRRIHTKYLGVMKHHASNLLLNGFKRFLYIPNFSVSVRVFKNIFKKWIIWDSRNS